MIFLGILAVILFLYFLVRSRGTTDGAPIFPLDEDRRCDKGHKWARLDDFFTKEETTLLREKSNNGLPNMFCKECGLIVGTDLGLDLDKFIETCRGFLTAHRRHADFITQMINDGYVKSGKDNL